jgi:hypothetical protein
VLAPGIYTCTTDASLTGSWLPGRSGSGNRTWPAGGTATPWMNVLPRYWCRTREAFPISTSQCPGIAHRASRESGKSTARPKSRPCAHWLRLGELARYAARHYSCQVVRQEWIVSLLGNLRKRFTRPHRSLDQPLHFPKFHAAFARSSDARRRRRFHC